MKKYYPLLILFFVFVTGKSFSQPFADVVSINYQTFSSIYQDSLKQKNKTDNYAFGFFLPKVFSNGNTLLIRLSGETINSTISPDSSYSSRLSSISLPLGFKFVSGNKKWETIVMGIPKIASDFKDAVDAYDIQYGGVFLQHFVPNEKVKIKAGLYYNREAFGNFFIPLVGIDWKATNRINLYGILPSNYKVEFNIVKEKLYTGFNFKSLTRSFRLSKKNNYDYIRYDEIQVKLFVDWFAYKKLLLFGEVGYSLGKNPWQYTFDTKDVTLRNSVYSPLNSYVIFNVGIAYRVRLDLENKKE